MYKSCCFQDRINIPGNKTQVYLRIDGGQPVRQEAYFEPPALVSEKGTKKPGLLFQLPGKWLTDIDTGSTSVRNEAHGKITERPSHITCPGVQHSAPHAVIQCIDSSL